MPSYNFATFWVEQWLKFLSAAGAWPAVDRESLDAQLAELRAGADKVELELKSVADERLTLRRDLAAAEEGAQATADALAEARSELAQARERADEERRQLTEEIGRLQRHLAEAEAAATAAADQRRALEADRDRLTGERDQLAAELDQVRQAADAERLRLDAEMGDLRQADEAATPPEPASAAAAGLAVHFKKPDDWAEPLFVHYWDDGRRTAWPGKPMIAEGEGWFHSVLTDVQRATLVFNDNGGHQTGDLERGSEGWYDGSWHDRKPGSASRRKSRKAAPA